MRERGGTRKYEKVAERMAVAEGESELPTKGSGKRSRRCTMSRRLCVSLDRNHVVGEQRQWLVTALKALYYWLPHLKLQGLPVNAILRISF